MSIRGIRVLLVIILMLAVASVASAQATRTWVSGVGDDANPCSRTAPCKTFAGAISKTAAGGEISALDPGGYGAVTITKSVTINGDGTLAGILAAGTNGVIVNAGVNDVVTLRSISIAGAGTGLDGIRYLAGKTLIVDNVDIYGFTSDGIEMNVSTNGPIMQIRDTSIHNCGATGVRTTHNTVGQRASVSWHGGNIMNCPTGFLASTRSNISLTGLDIANSATAGVTADGTTTEVNLDGVLLTQNNTALNTVNSGTARIANVAFFANGKVIDNLGSCASFGNNRFGGNVAANTGNALTTPGQQ